MYKYKYSNAKTYMLACKYDWSPLHHAMLAATCPVTATQSSPAPLAQICLGAYYYHSYVLVQVMPFCHFAGISCIAIHLHSDVKLRIAGRAGL